MKFSQESLENLVIATMNLRNEQNLLVSVSPRDVFSSLILDQLPAPVRDLPSTKILFGEQLEKQA